MKKFTNASIEIIELNDDIIATSQFITRDDGSKDTGKGDSDETLF